MANVQHNCRHAKCTADGKESLRQERETTSRARSVVRHRDQVNFVLNTHSLHNYQYIRHALSSFPHTSEHPSVFPDRPALHQRAAQSLRDTKLQKKLAREAQIRKTAEAALREHNTGRVSDVIAVLDADNAGLQDADEVSQQRPPQAAGADEGQNHVPQGGIALTPELTARSVVNTSTTSHPPVIKAPPRGPRRRRQVKPMPLSIPLHSPASVVAPQQSRSSASGSTASAQSGPLAGVPVDTHGCTPQMAPPAWTQSEVSNAHRSSADLGEESCATAPKTRIRSLAQDDDAVVMLPRKRQRRIVADPTNTATREAEIRSMFNTM